MDDELEYEWEGSLPPAGTACEGYILADTAEQGRPMNRWVEGIFTGPACASNGGIGGLFKATEGPTHFIGAYGYFRPLRSPEQIAEEAKQAHVDIMFRIVTGTPNTIRDGVAALYDAGCRIEVQP